MSEREVRERDILVASNEYAYVQDLTKGDIVLYVGPTKISLSNTERLVDYRDGRFVPVRGEDGLGVFPFVRATSSEYVLLDNPPRDESVRATKGPTSAVELRVGRRVVVPGPASFPLWPGQRARVLAGHTLKEDEYLVVRVIDAPPDTTTERLPIGAERIVRGTDTAFYVPTTGLEVVPTEGGGYVRRAHRLRPGQGLHVRVLKAFTQTEPGPLAMRNYAAGEELFLTEGEAFFFPTESLEVVDVVTAIPVGDGDGLYVRDRATGLVRTVLGPTSVLLDPTKEEPVSRFVDDRTALLYQLTTRRGDRALSFYVPSGAAVLVVSARGREVVRGPRARVLGIDERLEVLALSTGKPKSGAKTLETCFLQVDGNKVSDVVRLRTKDHVEVECKVSYRVSFTTDGGHGAERWFAVADYVGLLCDHLGSLMRAAARGLTLDRFHDGSTELLRRAVLGDKAEGAPRPGRLFDENGMWVYDMEVLEVKILDGEVKDLLDQAQRSAIVAELTKQREVERLERERVTEEANRGIFDARRATLAAATEHEAHERALRIAKAESEAIVERTQKVALASSEAEALSIRSSAEAAAAERDAALLERRRRAEVEAFREQMAALAPELVATLKTLGHQKLAEELTRHVAPLAILGGTSVSDVVERLLGSLPVGAGATVKAVMPRKAGA